MSNDLWATPPEVIDYIENRFGEIRIDLCASDECHVCELYLTQQEDFLDDNTLYLLEDVNHGSICWMNPPYSNPLPFVKQAIKWSEAGYAVAGILNNDPSTKWYVELEANAAIIMPIIGGRIAFLDDNGDPIGSNNKPQLMFYLAPFGSKTKSVDHVHIDEIYQNGKPKKNKVVK
jgi:phage N-6-adenine-methyltransferase